MSELVEVRVPDIGDFTDVPVIEVLVSPGPTMTSMIGTSVKSPMSGTRTSSGSATVGLLSHYSSARRRSVSTCASVAQNRAPSAPSMTRWS